MTTTDRAFGRTGSRTFRLAGTRGGPPLPQYDPPETLAALMPRADLLRAVAALLYVIADDARGYLDAVVGAEDDPGPAEPDHVLVPALIRAALGLRERQAGRFAARAALVPAMADLPGAATGPAPLPGEEIWPGEPLTRSETRVLRYLPTHMRVPEIATELCLSPNTVKTHLRHVYQKLGARSRSEAVQRARAIGPFTQSSCRPAATAGRAARHGVSNGTGGDSR